MFVSIICLVKGKKLQILFQNRCQLLQCSFTKLSKQNINYHQRNELEVIFLTYIIFLMNWVAFKAALYCVELLQIIIVKHWKLIILKEIITVQQECYFKSSFETFKRPSMYPFTIWFHSFSSAKYKLETENVKLFSFSLF